MESGDDHVIIMTLMSACDGDNLKRDAKTKGNAAKSENNNRRDVAKAKSDDTSCRDEAER